MKKLLFMTIASVMLFSSCEKDPIIPPVDTVLVGTLTENKTLTADKEWTLKGYVYVPEGITLTIEPGTVIKSDITEKGALTIERGGKIMAEGTADKPIVFTSGNDFPIAGDWGGVVILGRATTNKGEATIEGGIGRMYGGTNDDDNSGVLKYVRIEYAGIAAFANSEINALTLGAVGRGTTIEFVECYYSNDDAFEFFGGTVNPKYLVAVSTADDDYDFDFGYTGTVQYAISKRNPLFVDGGDAGNGIECDNDATGSTATPTTHPKLLNFTLIGPASSQSLSNHNLAMRWRRGTNFTVRNSVFYGYMKGCFSVESDITASYYRDNQVNFTNNFLHSVDTNFVVISKATNSLTTADMIVKVQHDGNTIYKGSQSPILNSFETISGNIGAIPQGTTNWLIGWTRF
jgi:hypothetical protein